MRFEYEENKPREIAAGYISHSRKGVVINTHPNVNVVVKVDPKMKTAKNSSRAEGCAR